MKTILVTGGGGFIGHHLSKRLLEAGHSVICVDNFFTGDKKNLLDHKNYEVIRHDITLPLYIEVDEIYNLACPASPIHYQRDAVQTTKTCVLGAINMLGLAKRVGAKIFQASTSEVYGNPLQHPQTERYWGNVNPIGPRSCYDEGKRCAETLFFDYYKKHSVKIKVGRLFNTYGPNMAINDGRVVSNFIMQALKNKPITIYGDGTQTRSFCYVSDTVELMIKFMENDLFPGPINMGNPHETTIFEIAAHIIQQTGSESDVVFKQLPVDDPTRRQPDITLASERYDWHPQVHINNGIAKTVNYFKELI